jgi:exopolysaccharide biosynthesis predicted pyruvyltransferase EpsI
MWQVRAVGAALPYAGNIGSLWPEFKNFRAKSLD